MRSSSDRLGLRFFRWVCTVGVLTEVGEGRGVGSRDWDEADPSGGPACELALEGKGGSGMCCSVGMGRSRRCCSPRFAMRGPLRDAETTSLLVPNRYALLTDLADHATGFVLTLAYGGREIVLLHRRDGEGLARWSEGWRVVLRMILRPMASIF